MVYKRPKWHCVIYKRPKWHCVMYKLPKWHCLMYKRPKWHCVIYKRPKWHCVVYDRSSLWIKDASHKTVTFLTWMWSHFSSFAAVTFVQELADNVVPRNVVCVCGNMIRLWNLLWLQHAALSVSAAWYVPFCNLAIKLCMVSWTAALRRLNLWIRLAVQNLILNLLTTVN